MSKFLKNILKINLSLNVVNMYNFVTINCCTISKTVRYYFHFIPVNENLSKVATTLTNYVKYESWNYCEKCYIVEPNKMLPTYGNQKKTHLKNCICTKGRYFVPMVWIILIFFLKSVSCIMTYIYIYPFIIIDIYIYFYKYLDTYI